MYDSGDTIAAVSSTVPPFGKAGRNIIRISGSESIGIAEKLSCDQQISRKRGILKSSLLIEGLPVIDCLIYCFPGPNSYTGDDLIEIHFTSARCVVDAVYAKIVTHARQAKAGEFTARAYLNGRMDLMQAEAVSQIVSGSNQYQIQAAEKLLSGKLTGRVKTIREDILNILSLMEAGMDFCGEDIEFISSTKAVEAVDAICAELQSVLSGNIHCEEMIDMPSVGLAGMPNAGKSSLLNILLGTDRCIVSDIRETTRDVLTGIAEFGNASCAIFDCAGLFRGFDKDNIITKLSQDAARQALLSASVIIYCIDAMNKDIEDDLAVSRTFADNEIIYVLTKCDLPDQAIVLDRLNTIEDRLNEPAIVTSSVTGQGIEKLTGILASRINQITAPACEMGQRIAINQRHRSVVSESLKNLKSASLEIAGENDEIAAMYLRSAYQVLAQLEAEKIDEAVLERIFSNFCIGK